MRSMAPEQLENGRVREGPYGSDASYGLNGAFFIYGPKGARLKIVASDGRDGVEWEHVSVSCEYRCPNWEEMSYVKDLFWEEDECVVQFHPPKSEHVNFHPYCLHLWRHRGIDMILPPSILVGPK